MVNKNPARLAPRLLVVAFLASPAAALAQHDGGSGGHGGSGGGCGDVFGDLVHILRDAATGQPILQKRWVEDTGPGVHEPGEGEEEVVVPVKIAYCPVALDAGGSELGFLPLSCDFAETETQAVIEVDYFGRLNAGRTKERNIRMHFDEVIEKIHLAQLVSRDATGRLALGTGCTGVDGDVDPATCTWDVVDSPLENLSLYHRLMKFGHIQTDPLEVDTWAMGDPALGIQYHPALREVDYAKFVDDARFLLPVHPRDAATCFAEGYTGCFASKPLTLQSFGLAASFVGTAADKTGHFSADLLHYLNRIIKVTVTTGESAATLPMLPARYRDCGLPPEELAATQSDFVADPTACAVLDADATFPAPANEQFVDYGVFRYARGDWFAFTVPVVRPVDPTAVAPDAYFVDNAVPLLEWLADVNPGGAEGTNVAGMVAAANDAVRAIEFVHNYAIPAPLWDFSY